MFLCVPITEMVGNQLAFCDAHNLKIEIKLKYFKLVDERLKILRTRYVPGTYQVHTVSKQGSIIIGPARVPLQTLPTSKE